MSGRDDETPRPGWQSSSDFVKRLSTTPGDFPELDHGIFFLNEIPPAHPDSKKILDKASHFVSVWLA
jgi:hypothetical protein